MNRKEVDMKRKQFLAFLLSAALMSGSAAAVLPAYAAQAQAPSQESGEDSDSSILKKRETGKEETVYVFTDASGNIKDITVSS